VVAVTTWAVVGGDVRTMVVTDAGIAVASQHGFITRYDTAPNAAPSPAATEYSRLLVGSSSGN
jgi:hypothetical protein